MGETSPRARLTTMVGPERTVSLPSHTNDGGEITVPYLTWSPASDTGPCQYNTGTVCGYPHDASVHNSTDGHAYVGSRGGMLLVLDHRLGYNIPTSLSDDEADALIEFVANAIAIGAGYASIYYTKRKMPFRG